MEKPKGSVSAKAVIGAIVSVELLSLFPLIVRPDNLIKLDVEFVQTVPISAVHGWVSNFITSDGQYFVLADGKVLFVKEE